MAMARLTALRRCWHGGGQDEPSCIANNHKEVIEVQLWKEASSLYSINEDRLTSDSLSSLKTRQLLVPS